MPLVKRKVSPVRLARRPSSWGTTDSGEEVTLRGEYDLTAVTNVTLCGALRQLASLVTAAQDVSQELQEELGKINIRSSSLASRLAALEGRVAAHNPRAVPVPEGDLRSFSERRDHYRHTDQAAADLFTQTSRPSPLLSLYDKANQTPVHIMREIDQLRDDGIRSSRYFLCEPVLGDSLKKEKLRKLNLDIETRRPASFVALREWCSDDETLTEVCLSPVSPSVPARVCPPQKEPAAHKLPSPEQRVLALSLKYPPELVPIDVSGTGFKRLEKFRQSLVHFEYYKGKHRRKRVKRRNTIADTRDVQIALADREAASTSSGRGRSSPRSGSPSSRGGVSYTDRSFDTTETLDTTSNTTKTSLERENHPLSLGIEVCVPAPPRNVHTVSRHMARENTFRENELTNKEGAGSSGGHPVPIVGSRQALGPHIYETIKNSKRDTTAEKQRSHLPISTHSPAMNVAVKLREATKDEGTHSSSGNWSASSSTRTSVESDQQRPLAASPTSSYEQDSVPSESLHIRSSSPSSNLRTNSRTTDDLPSTSSHTSDGTLTPTQDIQDIPFLDDDTSSAYSCDTEGYYTSFHIDSGIRSVSYEGNKLAESEYELFGKGSTGTTNSSASIGTVVMRNPEKKTPPKPPQRVSSLERKQENRESVITVIHVNGSTSSREDVAGEAPDKASSQDGDSRSSRDGDSGRETSSSPTEPTSPRQPSLPSPEMEFSESDLEADRQEILRVKTTINSSRIPSMCVITPPQSDDESVRSGNVSLSRESSGSQTDNQGQQAPPQGLMGSLINQGQSHGVTAKMLSFQNSGAKSGGARSVGANSGGKNAVDGSVGEKKDSGGKVPVVSHGYTPTLTVIPRGKDGDINAHLKGIMHTAAVSAPARPDPDQPVLIRPSLVKQAEREKRLSLESDDSQNSELHRQTSKEEKQKIQSEKGQVQSSELVSYKELPPPTTTAAHPFSAVPSSVKQNVVITPTNSLERRKANPTKGGARVTLNSDGKVVYSSDSLPRRKGHSSFEPGPYIKPQVTSSAQVQAVGSTASSTVPSTAHVKPAAPGTSSSIQHTPLPAPPTSSVNTDTATSLPHPMAQRPQQPLPHSASIVSSVPAGFSHSKQFQTAATQSTQSSSVTITHSVPVSTPKSQSTPKQTVSTPSSLPTQSSHSQAALLPKIQSSSLSSSTSSSSPASQSVPAYSTHIHPAPPSVSHPVPQSQPHPIPSTQPHQTLTSQPHPVIIPAQPHSTLTSPHPTLPALQPTFTSQPHPVLPPQAHMVLPAQPQAVLQSQTHQISQVPPSLPHSTLSQANQSLPSQPYTVSTQPHPVLSQPHPVSSHPHPIQATQPHPVQTSQSLPAQQMHTPSQLLSNTSPQSILLPTKQAASPHLSVKTQAKSDPLVSHQGSVPPTSSLTLSQTTVTGQHSRTPQPLPQQRLQQSTQQPQSPSNQKQITHAGKGESEPALCDKQISSVSGSSNSIYGTTQQQQLRQQQQQILQARQEAQRQLLQQQQQQIYQTRQEAQRVIQQQQLQQLQQQQLQQQQMQQLQQQQLQQQFLYQTKDEAQMQLQQQQIILQQPIYQTHQEAQQTRQQIPHPPQSLSQQHPQAVATSGSVIMASQGAPMSPRSQRAGAYVHVQGQAGASAQQTVAAAQTSQGTQSGSKGGQHSQNSQGYTPGDTTSRAPTPVQGPITSSPRRGAQPSTVAFTHQHLRTDPGMLYGSQRSLQSVGLLPEGRGTGQPQQPPRPISTSPPPYSDHHHSLTDSDIYGRIGMTRHVQVGGTLPAGFGRHQRGYNSLPPSRRQSYVPQTVEEQQLFLQQQQQQLSRRSSVASYTAGVDNRDGQRAAASNPSTPEKVLDKKEKSSKKEKDKKKKEAKTEKSPKKKWFWTLPLRRKKKNKEESTEEDDGGFKAASEKGARKLLPRDDSSFIRYPSPDTASSDMNSSYSSEMSGEHSYRSSPSSEVYYYSRRSQQQTMQLHQQQQQQQQQQKQQQQGSGVGPRSLPTTPVSPPDNSQSSFVSVSSASQGVMSDVTDLTVTDLTRGRRYMSREELYAAMRHPQYYNYHRGTMTTPTSDYSGQRSTPTPSRSTSPAVFGVSPLPPYTIRPQAQTLYSAWPPDQQTDQQQTESSLRDQPTTQQLLSESHSEDTSPTADVEPPEAYQDLATSEGLSLLESQARLSPRKPPCGQESSQSQQSQQSQQNQQPLQSTQSTPKQTSRGDFKKMILNKSMSSAGGNHRISAVEMLKASRPGIYGYSPPPAPVVKPPQPSPSPSRGEGVIIPPSSRNTARALLFQSRFGSGRRFRTPKTEIISTTILEDHGGEVVEQEEEEEEEEEDSSSESPDHSTLQNVRGPLARAYSEPCASSHTKSTSPSSSPVDEVAHSTPNTTLEQPPQPPDVSIINPDPMPELQSTEKDKENDEKESMETAL